MKQKSIELYNKFKSKKIALICINEFIEVFTNLEMLEEIRFWKGVKLQLKKKK